MSKINRREMITWLGSTAASLYLGKYLTACSSISKMSGGVGPQGAGDLGSLNGMPDFFPIEALSNPYGQSAFSGDNPTRAHGILWQKDAYIESRRKDFPSEPERVQLAVLGGGLSGLSSAYLLKDYKPLLIEQYSRFGGNSRGESWNGLPFSIGAAYFANPAEDSKVRKFLVDCDAWKKIKIHSGDTPFEHEGQVKTDFWSGISSPKHKADFLRVKKIIDDHANERNGKIFPDIPILDTSRRQAVSTLDRMGFIQYLEKESRGKLHPHILAALEFYCWSSFGGSAHEISAAQGLNFYAGESDGTAVFPGGNAGLTQHLTEKLVESIGSERMRCDSVIFDVRVDSNGVNIYYEDSSKNIHWVQAQAAVCAMPKFIAKKVFRDFEPERVSAISELKYTSYLVANLLVEKPVFRDFYDMFLLGNGKVDTKNIRAAADLKGTTDVVCGSYAAYSGAGGGNRCVYTLYRALPYQGARANLYSPQAFKVWKDQFENEIDQRFIPLLGLKRSDIKGVRVTRWGHPLPVAAKGLIANHTVDKLFKPFRERVFFVQQDNWALPAMETCITEAVTWTDAVRKYLS